MSIESAKAFLKRMNEDVGFRNKILELEDVEARLSCAKAEGFDFTREEMDGLAVDVAVGGGKCSCLSPTGPYCGQRNG